MPDNSPQRVEFYGRNGEIVALVVADSVLCVENKYRFFFGRLPIATLDDLVLQIGTRKIDCRELDLYLTLSKLPI